MAKTGERAIVSRRATLAACAALVPGVASAAVPGAGLLRFFGFSDQRAAGPRPAARTPAAAPSSLLATAEMDRWQDAIGASFSMIRDDLSASVLRLAEVNALEDTRGTRPPTLARAKGFVLTFDLVSGKMPEGDRTYGFSNAQFGRLDVFLSSATARPNAIFN